MKAYMSIDEFAYVDGAAIPKRSDFFGGHYNWEDIPDGKITSVRENGKGARSYSSKEEFFEQNQFDY